LVEVKLRISQHINFAVREKYGFPVGLPLLKNNVKHNEMTCSMHLPIFVCANLSAGFSFIRMKNIVLY